MSLSSRMKQYIAPDGYVYDWINIPDNGTHLYVKYLFLNKNDNIINYKLVPEGEKNDN